MKILYKGSYCEKYIFDEIVKENQGPIPFAQEKLESLIIKGLEDINDNIDISILSTIPISRYPKYRKIIINKKSKNMSNYKLIYLRFINLPIIKQLTEFLSLTYQTIKWAIKNRREEDSKYVLLYGTNPLNTMPIMLFRRIFRYKVITIVSEIDKLRFFKVDSFILKIKKKIFVSLSKKLENSFDGYILLSEHMNDCININKRPSVVIEGMVDSNICKTDIVPYSTRKNYIMYAGSLNQKYGIDKLIEAFAKIDDEEYKLLIFGDGDYKNKIIEISDKNNKIEYGGVVSNDKILELERKVKLLVNPRPSEEEFTKYSFPSKTLEYMSSGTAILITKLEGIPEEYFKYCYYFDDESVDGFVKTLSNIIKKKDSEIEKKAYDARKFAIKEKNNKKQTKKIIDFLRLL